MKSYITLMIFCALLERSTLLASGTIHQLEEVCFKDYSELGCFPNTYPWVSVLRPFPPPMDPKKINTKLYLFTRKFSNERYAVKLWKNISLKRSDFDPRRPYTAFITHGFLNNGNKSWVNNLKNAYLKDRDANIFIVDWGKGASSLNYLQVAANTRVVGAELKRFANYLVETWKLDPARIHFMGHSLGAHISSYAAKGVPGVGQVTGLDAAQPGFEPGPPAVRIDKNDAKFVDLIHTSTFPLGGMISPVGDNDYYINGGSVQPGCVVPPLSEVNFTNIADLGNISTNNPIYKLISCSHEKSRLYYTEALLNDNCTFWGRSTDFIGFTSNLITMGRFDAALAKFDKCTLDECSPMGLESESYPARGVFSISTNANSPYCQNNTGITEQMRKLRQQRLQQESNVKSSTI